MGSSNQPPAGPGEPKPPGNRGGSLPAWRFSFFAALLAIVVVGGGKLGIPREVAIPAVVGCLLALANGYLPTWFGREK